MAPGINLIGLTILIGRKVGGISGICASLAGLLVPSAGITCLLTAGFVGIQNFPATQAVLQGVIPATAGIMVVVGIKYAQPLWQELRAEGKWQVFIGLVMVIVATLAIALWQISIALILIGSAILSILCFSNMRVTPPPSTVETVAVPQEAEETHD